MISTPDLIAVLAANLTPVRRLRPPLTRATWWATAPHVWRAAVRRGIAAYFVQDIETSYYPGHPEVHSFLPLSQSAMAHERTCCGDWRIPPLSSGWPGHC